MQVTRVFIQRQIKLEREIVYAFITITSFAQLKSGILVNIKWYMGKHKKKFELQPLDMKFFLKRVSSFL